MADPGLNNLKFLDKNMLGLILFVAFFQAFRMLITNEATLRPCKQTCVSISNFATVLHPEHTFLLRHQLPTGPHKQVYINNFLTAVCSEQASWIRHQLTARLNNRKTRRGTRGGRRKQRRIRTLIQRRFSESDTLSYTLHNNGKNNETDHSLLYTLGQGQDSQQLTKQPVLVTYKSHT